MCIPVAKGQTGDPSCLWANRVSVANVVAGLALSVPRYTLLSMDVQMDAVFVHCVGIGIVLDDTMQNAIKFSENSTSTYV